MGNQSTNQKRTKKTPKNVKWPGSRNSQDGEKQRKWQSKGIDKSSRHSKLNNMWIDTLHQCGREVVINFDVNQYHKWTFLIANSILIWIILITQQDPGLQQMLLFSILWKHRFPPHLQNTTYISEVEAFEEVANGYSGAEIKNTTPPRRRIVNTNGDKI